MRKLGFQCWHIFNCRLPLLGNSDSKFGIFQTVRCHYWEILIPNLEYFRKFWFQIWDISNCTLPLLGNSDYDIGILNYATIIGIMKFQCWDISNCMLPLLGNTDSNFGIFMLRLLILILGFLTVCSGLGEAITIGEADQKQIMTHSWVISLECSLLRKAQSACVACLMLEGSGGMPPRKILKNRCSEIEFESISGS